MPCMVQHPFSDPDLDIEERIDDLISRLTLGEKTSQLLYASPEISRLGIPAYNWWNEALHGVGRAGRATVFPQAIGLAATFDPALVGRVATAIADEARAKHHEAARNGQHGQYKGLTFWTPNINIFRDPRWGRGQETYGEDPYLTGEIGAAFVRGLQGSDQHYLKTAACAKHYAVHSGPEPERHVFDAVVDDHDLWETYLPAFKRLVDEGVESVMGAYNRMNGEPCCGSELLLVTILRGEWEFAGHVVSDCGAVGDFHEHHKVTSTAAESAALAVHKGCDLNCGKVYEHLNEALERNLLDEADIDRSLRRLLRTRFKLGMFDPPDRVRFAATPMSVVHSEAHRELARQAARESIVLLKNKGILPLPSDTERAMVVGSNATNVEILMGNYYGMSPQLTTILEGIAAKVSEYTIIDFAKDCHIDHPSAESLKRGFYAGRAAKVVIACLGLAPMLEGEEGESIASTARGDRESIKLPQHQVDYIKSMAGGDAKLVLVLAGGSAIDFSDIEDLCDAIVMVWYPGEAGGEAIAEVLFGETTPSGRLPVSFPREEDLPPFRDYSMRGRTYRYAKARPIYPFGYGLSYTNFAYGAATASENQLPVLGPRTDGHAAAREGTAITVTVEVTNSGRITGDEVVQVYWRAVQAPFACPEATLVGFRRSRIAAGKTKRVAIEIPTERLTLVDAGGRSARPPGDYELLIAGASPGERSRELGVAFAAPIHIAVGE